jgi:hypothetical protein
MSLEMPTIILLLLANALWYLVGWAKGFNEGKREGLVVGKNYQHVSVKRDIYALPSDIVELNDAR